MRLYFKGAALGVALLLLVVLIHQHFRSRHHTLATATAKRSRARHMASREGLSAETRGHTSRVQRQGTTTPLARPTKKRAKKRKSSSSSIQGPSQGPDQVVHERIPPASSSGEQSAGRPISQQSRVLTDHPPSQSAPVVPAPRESVSREQAPAPVSSSRDATLEVMKAAPPQTDQSSKVAAGSVSNDGAPNPSDLIDIRTVDPLSATEPMVMRQQEELEQQRFGFQPWRGRPKPPEKIQDLSQSWLTNMEFPDWYLESVKRSKVYGWEGDFVGGGPLFEEPCPDAAKVKAQYAAEKVQTYSYIEPGKFLPASKNPCWYDDPKRNRLMRCIPYFYVAGVAKCGTTDLYKRIRYHPDIMEGELKEYHWWDRLRYGAPMELKFTKDSEKNDSPLPLSEYSRIITGKEIEKLKQELRASNHSEKICGDGSPSYLWDPSQWTIFEGNEGCTEPRIVSGSFIQHAYPQSKIFLIFRHPTQRLYSRFLSRIPRYPPFKGATPRTFHDFVVKGVACYKRCFQEHSIRECAYNKTLYDEAVLRLVEGMYSVFVEDWFRIFKREQIMVIRNEDYSEDIEGHILKVFDFLGVATLGKSEMRPVLTHVSTNIGQNYDKVGPMLPETIAVLNEFYKPFVLRLHQLLGDDRFLWKDIAVT